MVPKFGNKYYLSTLFLMCSDMADLSRNRREISYQLLKILIPTKPLFWGHFEAQIKARNPPTRKMSGHIYTNRYSMLL